MIRILIFLLLAHAGYSQQILQANTLRANSALILNGSTVNGITTSISGGSNNSELPTAASVWGVVNQRLSTVSVGTTLTGNGTTGSPLQLAQQGATNGQALRWNGSSYVPSGVIGNQVNVWHQSEDGINRFFFLANAGTYIRGVGEITLRNLTDSDLFTVYHNGVIRSYAYGQGNITGPVSTFLGSKIDGIFVEMGATEMSQKTGNWGGRFPHASQNSMAAANSYEGFTFVGAQSQVIADAPVPNTTAWYTMSVRLGSEHAIESYSAQLAFPREIENPTGSYLWLRYRELGSFTGWQKFRAGTADNIILPASTGQVLRSTGGTGWAPSAGFTLSGTGEITSTPLSGTGNRLLAVNSSGTFLRSVIDPDNLATNLGIGTHTTNFLTLTSSTGTSVDIPVSTTSLSGLMSGADKTKLNGLQNFNASNWTIGAQALTMSSATSSLELNTTSATSTSTLLNLRANTVSSGGTSYVNFISGNNTVIGSIRQTTIGLDMLFRANSQMNIETEQAAGIVLRTNTAGTPMQWTYATSGLLFLPSLAANPGSGANGSIYYNFTEERLKTWLSGSGNGLGHQSLMYYQRDFVGAGATIYNTTNTQPTYEYYTILDANAGSLSWTLGSNLVEGLIYTIVCRRNATNTITFSAGSGLTLDFDGEGASHPNDSPVVVGGAGTGSKAPHKVYSVKRMGNNIAVF